MELNQSDWNKEMVFFIQKQQIAATRSSRFTSNKLLISSYIYIYTQVNNNNKKRISFLHPRIF